MLLTVHDRPESDQDLLLADFKMADDWGASVDEQEKGLTETVSILQTYCHTELQIRGGIEDN